MKFSKLLGLALIACLPATTFAETPVSVIDTKEIETVGVTSVDDLLSNIGTRGGVELKSDYTFRGISQTGGSMALSGFLEVNAPLGLVAPIGNINDIEVLEGPNVYLRATSFSIDLEGAGRLKVDLDAGLRGAVDKLDYDVGVTGYLYPAGARNLDFVEPRVGLGYSLDSLPLSPRVSGAIHYSPDFFRGSGSAVYTEANVDLSLPLKVGLNLHGGRQWIEDNITFGTPDYYDWSAKVSRNFFGIDTSVAAVGTSLDSSTCGGLPACGNRVVVGVGLRF